MANEKNSLDHGIDKYHGLSDDSDFGEQLSKIYAAWADAYDHDNDHKLGTVSQPTAAALLARHVDDVKTPILDVGCGTGLVGHHLARHGFTTFDGTDLSTEMLDNAKKRGYRNLFAGDASKGLDIADGSYGAVMCVGVFTHGHLGTNAFTELLRLTQSNGTIVFTVNEGVWHSGGFDDEISQLEAHGLWVVLERSHRDYMVKEGVKAWYIAARKV